MSPLQEQVDSFVLDLPEPEALVQAQRGIERSTWMRSSLPAVARRAKAGFARRLRFGPQLPEQRRSDSRIAGVRQQRDVDDADLLRPARDVEVSAARCHLPLMPDYSSGFVKGLRIRTPRST